MRIDGPYGSVAFDGHTVEVVGGAHGNVSRLAVTTLIEVVRQVDKEGRECVLFFSRGGGASTRFPPERAAELDAVVAAVNAARG